MVYEFFATFHRFRREEKKNRHLRDIHFLTCLVYVMGIVLRVGSKYVSSMLERMDKPAALCACARTAATYAPPKFVTSFKTVQS